MRILALILACLIWIGIVSFVKLRVELNYNRREKNDYLEISFSAWKGIWQFSMQIPVVQLDWDKGPQIKIQDKTESPSAGERTGRNKMKFRYFSEEYFLRVFPKIPRVTKILKDWKVRFYRGIHCLDLNFRIGIGYSDPMLTALATGSIWSVLNYFLARMHRDITMEATQPVVFVEPYFQKEGFDCSLHGVFSLRIGHLLLTGWDGIRAMRRLNR